MSKLYDLRQGVAVANGAGLTFDPLLMEPVNGVDTLVAPDICIPVPKAIGAGGAVSTALAVGNVTVVQNAAGPINFDILTIRLHTMQRALAAANLYSSISQAVAIADGGGTAIDPALTRASVLQVPNIAIPVPKAVPGAVTRQTFVPTSMATGAITFQHGEAAPVNHDILMTILQDFQNVQNALFGGSQDHRRYFTIADNGPDASIGAVYSDDDDATRRFRVLEAKVSADGSTLLTTEQIAGSTVPTTGGADNLSLVSGTGDADIAYTGVRFEKYMDLQNDVSVVNGAGLTFDPGLVEDGVPVMPDIVIPVPKAADTVPFVATDLTGAVGTVTVAHNNAGAIDHDILSIRAHSIFRDVG